MKWQPPKNLLFAVLGVISPLFTAMGEYKNLILIILLVFDRFSFSLVSLNILVGNNTLPTLLSYCHFCNQTNNLHAVISLKFSRGRGHRPNCGGCGERNMISHISRLPIVSTPFLSLIWWFCNVLFHAGVVKYLLWFIKLCSVVRIFVYADQVDDIREERVRNWTSSLCGHASWSL